MYVFIIVSPQINKNQTQKVAHTLGNNTKSNETKSLSEAALCIELNAHNHNTNMLALVGIMFTIPELKGLVN